MVLPEDLLDHDVRVDVDLGMGYRPVLHDLAGAERLAPVEHVDLGRKARQEEGLFEGRVAPADDRDLLVPEEEAITSRARGHPAATQASLAFDPQPQRGCAGRHDHGLGGVLDAPRPGMERPAGQVHPVHVDVFDVCPEPFGLGPEQGHQIRPLDTVWEARIVLDVARDHELTARCRSGQDDGLEVGASAVDRSREAGRPGPDDEQLRMGSAPASRLARWAARRSDGARLDGDRAEAKRTTGWSFGAAVGGEVDGQTPEWRGRLVCRRIGLVHVSLGHVSSPNASTSGILPGGIVPRRIRRPSAGESAPARSAPACRCRTHRER